MAEEMTATTGGNAAAEETSAAGAESTAEQSKTTEALSTEALDRIVQSRVDKITAEQGKKIAALQKELDKTKREAMSADEVAKIEAADREKALAEREQALLDKENRLYAIKAIQESGLDDGKGKSLELIDFVLDKDEAGIDAKVKAFKSLVDRLVSAKVEETFRTNGRVPNGATHGTGEGGKNGGIAETLGKQAAERNKAANDILNYYYGGKK